MAIRDAFNDDAYEMYRMDNVLDSVNLNVIGWNRATVADGQWLQDNAIGPLSARDVYLADCIDDVNTIIGQIQTTLNDAGISTDTSGEASLGYSVKPENNRLTDTTAHYLPNTMSWSNLPVSLVPSGIGDVLVPPASLTFMTIGAEATEADGLTGLNNELAGVLSINLTANAGYQLAFAPDGLYYRAVTGTTTTAAIGNNNDVTYVVDSPDFKKLPVDAITQDDLDTALTPYAEKNKQYSNLSAGYAVSAGSATTAHAISGNNAGTPSAMTFEELVAKLNSIPGQTTYTEIEIDASTSAITGINGTGIAARYMTDGTDVSSFTQLSAAIHDKSVVTVSENAPWVSTITVDSTAHLIFNPYEHTSNLFVVTGDTVAGRKLDLKYNTAVFTADSNNGLDLKYNTAVFTADSNDGLDFRVGSDFTLPVGGPLALAPISLSATHWNASHSKTIADWLLYIMNTLNVTEPTT